MKLLPPANEVWGKVMFLHLCVILYTGRGGSALDADPPGLGRLPWGWADPLGLGRPPRLGKPPVDADPPQLGRPPGVEQDSPGCRLPEVGQTPADTVNKRAVRILLECILVQKLVRINERISQPFTFVILTI